MTRLEEVTLRLAAIQDALMALPDGASSERHELLKERDALRAEAAGFSVDHDQNRSTQELEAELASLRHRRKQIVGARSGYATGKGGNNAGPASGAWVKLAEQSKSAGGLGVLNARISQIEDVLATRARQGLE